MSKADRMASPAGSSDFGLGKPSSGMPLDHILWATHDLDDGIAHFERLTGIRAARGGRHPGRGTHNALLALTQNSYLEIIAPDPSQSLDNNLGATIKALPSPGIFTFAVQCNDMPSLVAAAKRAKIAIEGPDNWSREQPDGPTLRWLLAFTNDTPFGRYVPFYIDWQKSPHPSTTTPGGLQLLDFTIRHPEHAQLSALYAALNIDVRVAPGDRPDMLASLQGPRGPITLTSTGPQ